MVFEIYNDKQESCVHTVALQLELRYCGLLIQWSLLQYGNGELPLKLTISDYKRSKRDLTWKMTPLLELHSVLYLNIALIVHNYTTGCHF